MGLIYADVYNPAMLHMYIRVVVFFFAILIFTVTRLSTKSVKIGLLENFILYSIQSLSYNKRSIAAL